MPDPILPTAPREFLRRKEAAAFINMSVAFLRERERLGKGPERSRCGKVPVYHVDALRRWMAEQIER
jgi:hypothetical protein